LCSSTNFFHPAHPSIHPDNHSHPKKDSKDIKATLFLLIFFSLKVFFGLQAAMSVVIGKEVYSIHVHTYLDVVKG